MRRFNSINRKIKMLVTPVFAGVILYSCQTETVEKTVVSNNLEKVKYAQCFTIENTSDSNIVSVYNPETKKVIGRYAFAKTALPTIATLSTTHIPFLEKLGVLNQVKGVAYADLIRSEKTQAKLAAGDIIDIKNADGIDQEKMLLIQPDYFLVYPFNEQRFPKIEAAGTQNIYISEYLEETPLGRAEWIKVFGAMFNKTVVADSIFTEIEKAYNSTKQNASHISSKPNVFTASHFNGDWFVPGNQSLIASFIRDAGGNYSFDHIEGRDNKKIEFESLYIHAMKADYWGKVQSFSAEKLEDFVGKDARLYKLPSVVNKQLFVCNANEVDYFGEAIIAPHQILSDLYAILHGNDSVSKNNIYFKPCTFE